MKTFTTIIAASALLSYVSGSPIQARNTCGSVPAGSGSDQPLSQPPVDTAAACQAAGAADSSCKSFIFGFNGAIICKLYPFSASEVPPQSSANLLAYDLACASVPVVVPTTSNPTGADNPSASPSNAGNNPDSSGKSGYGTPTLAVRDTCGVAPTAPTGNTSPIATPPDIGSLAACLAACQAYSSCESCGFGSSGVCNLYSVPAASVPAPTDGESIVVSDVGCSSSPVATGGNPANSPLSNAGNNPHSNSSPSNAGNNPASNGKSGNGSPK